MKTLKSIFQLSIALLFFFISTYGQPNKVNKPQQVKKGSAKVDTIIQPVTVSLGQLPELVYKMDDIIQKQNKIIEQQNEIIQKLSSNVSKTPQIEKTAKEDKDSKLKLGLAVTAFTVPKTIRYWLTGLSNPVPDTLPAKMGIGLNALLLWDVNKYWSAVISVPISQSLFAFTSQSLGGKQAPIGVGIARAIRSRKDKEIIKIGLLANFSQYNEIPEENFNCQCFPITTFKNLTVGERIPDDIIAAKSFSETRIKSSLSFSIIFPIKEL